MQKDFERFLSLPLRETFVLIKEAGQILRTLRLSIEMGIDLAFQAVRVSRGILTYVKDVVAFPKDKGTSRKSNDMAHVGRVILRKWDPP